MKGILQKEDKASVSGNQQPCTVCGKKIDTRKCTRCKKISYCSSTCQKADWPKHRKTCTGSHEAGPTAEANFLSGVSKGFLKKPSMKDDQCAETAPESTPENKLPEDPKEFKESEREHDSRPKITDSSKTKKAASGKSQDMAERPTSQEMRECKVCRKEGGNLEARVVYYCSIGCHENDGGRSYPVSILDVSKEDGRQGEAGAGVELKETRVEPALTKGSGDSIKRCCDYCGRRSNTSEACPNCGKVFYCSPACCKVDYPQHRSVCKGKST